MSHVALTVVMKKDGVRFPSTADRGKQVNELGGLFHTGPYEVSARAISKLPWVERVVATLVTETNVGTWRKGKKS